MTPRSLRIPRISTAVVLLGSACGDEGERSLEDRTKGSDTSAARKKRVARAGCEKLKACEPDAFSESTDMAACIEAGVENFDELSADAPDGCADATLDAAECNASRACDEFVSEDCRAYVEASDEACGTMLADIDINQDRITSVAESFCAFIARCEPEREDGDDRKPCVDDLVDEFTHFEPIEFECLDAYLDLYECYANSACETPDERCGEEYDATYAFCGTYSYASNSTSHGARRARQRIPR